MSHPHSNTKPSPFRRAALIALALGAMLGLMGAGPSATGNDSFQVSNAGVIQQAHSTIALANPTATSALTSGHIDVSAAANTAWSIPETNAVDGQWVQICNTGTPTVTTVQQAGVWQGGCILNQGDCVDAVYSNNQWTQKSCSSDNRFGTSIEPGNGERVFRPTNLTAGGNFTQASGVANCEYIGRVEPAAGITIQRINFPVATGGSGTQAAELAIFTTPSAPNGASQVLTKLVATGTITSLTTTGVKQNTSPFATVAPQNAHLWLCLRIQMGTTQPVLGLGNILQDMGTGQILTVAAPGALTGVTTMTGAVVTEAGVSEGVVLIGTLD